LEALDQLCRANGARFLFVVPPSYQQGGETILRTGRERGITVLLPVSDNEFDGNDYQEDGIHMNENGARIFTERLAVDLNKELAK
jgi:lysophospholipase L1-like esterase